MVINLLCQFYVIFFFVVCCMCVVCVLYFCCMFVLYVMCVVCVSYVCRICVVCVLDVLCVCVWCSVYDSSYVALLYKAIVKSETILYLCSSSPTELECTEFSRLV